jgi:hypothetical protein
MVFIVNLVRIFSAVVFASVLFSAAAHAQSINQIPAGTRLWLRSEQPVNSKYSSADDTFTAKLSRPVVISDVVVIGTGIVVEGRVVSSREAGFAGKNGRLMLSFETMFFANIRRDMRGKLVEPLEADSPTRTNIAAVGGSTAAGALIGLAAGSRGGSLIGAGIGAGGGIGYLLLKKGSNVGIDKGQEFEIELTEPLIVPLTDF